MTEFSRAHRAFGRRDREGDSDSAMNPSMGARTVHSGQLLKPGGSFWVFRMSNEFSINSIESEMTASMVQAQFCDWWTRSWLAGVLKHDRRHKWITVDSID